MVREGELELAGVERLGGGGFSEWCRVFSMHEIGAHESNELEEARDVFDDLMQGAQEKKGDQRDRDLDAHGVFRSSDEFRDPERLLHQPEEQLDLPAAPVEIGDLLRRRVEIVGQEAQGLAGLGPATTSRTASCIGFLRFIAGAAPAKSRSGR